MKARDLNSKRPTPPTMSPTSSVKQALKETAAKGREAARGQMAERKMCACEYNAHRDKRQEEREGKVGERLRNYNTFCRNLQRDTHPLQYPFILLASPTVSVHLPTWLEV